MNDNPVHTNLPIECQPEFIQELAEQCDNEYYMSALGPLLGGNRERAERGLARIREAIEKFNSIQSIVKCAACSRELAKQIQLSTSAMREIESVWQF